MGEAAEVRARRTALRERKRELEARLSAGEDRALRLELAGVTEDLIDADRRLRELTPRHRISYKTTWAGAEGRAWDWMQYHTWAELEGAEDREGPTERELMLTALREARGAATAKQAEYLAAVEAGDRAASVARSVGRDKSTLSRTLTRGRANISREAQARYRLKKAAAEARAAGRPLDLTEPAAMDALLSMLTERQQLYIYLYYGEWMSLGEIGSLLGVDRAGVLRTVRRGLERIAGELAGLEVTGLESLEARLTEHFSELGPEDLKAKEGRYNGPPKGRTAPRAAEAVDAAPLEAGRVLFQGGGDGRLRAWLEGLRERMEAARGRPLERREQQGFFRRLLSALVRRVNEARKGEHIVMLYNGRKCKRGGALEN